jgi:hypothetical protein
MAFDMPIPWASNVFLRLQRGKMTCLEARGFQRSEILLGIPRPFDEFIGLLQARTRRARLPQGLVPEGRYTIVARHEVPGKTSSQESRPVGYGLIHAGERTDSSDWSDEISKYETVKKDVVLYLFSLA